METLTIGEKCYWNTVFSGLVSCKVIDINNNGLKIKITATGNQTYKKGEVIDVSYNSIIPKRFYKRTGTFRFVSTKSYKWEIKNENTN